MLTTWLVELFLNDLGALKDEGDRDGYVKMTQEFHSFLETKNLRVIFAYNIFWLFLVFLSSFSGMP